ncbi:MAG: SpoIIE family protein phosphatase [Salinivirgaceae bacterium]|nr:SpoIIE family protein phosphatase [Salinivirgaceae bacterium]
MKGKRFNKWLETIMLCAALCVCTNVVCAQSDNDDARHYFDSLTALLNGNITPEERLELLGQISYEHYNVDSTAKYANMALELARKLKNSAMIGSAYNLLGWCSYIHDDSERACQYYREAINCFDSAGLTAQLALSYYGLASALNVMGDDMMADDYYNQALNIYVEQRDTFHVADIWRKKGIASMNFHLFMTAEEYFVRALKLDSLRNDSAAIGKDIYMLGANEFSKYKDYADMQALTLARNMMLDAYGIEERYGDWAIKYMVVQSLMDLYMEMAKHAEGEERAANIDSSRFFLNLTKSAIENSSLTEDAVYIDFWEADYLILSNRAAEALTILQRVELMPSLAWEKEMRMCDLIIDCYQQLGDYKNALKYTNLRTMLDKETYKRDFAVKTTRSSTALEFERDMHQRELAAQRQKYVIRIVAVSLVLMSSLFVTILLGFLRKRKLSRELAMQKDEVQKKNDELKLRNDKILTQRDEIEMQRNSIIRTNQAITASINYAKHVQDAAVTSKEVMDSIFGDSLIIWKPMNIVSGDFYWAVEKNGLKMIAVADCTGHGVAGAFMSMFGISTLNSVTATSQTLTSAAGVLNQMRAKIIEELHQSSGNGESLESIDMAFCIIDSKTMQMHYAGANRPLLIVRDGKMLTYKPDKMPVGLHVLHSSPFTDNIIDLKPDDRIYFYTDGITDQFGSDGTRDISKFSNKRLCSMLTELANLPFDQQSAIISERLALWRTQPNGTLMEQIDDQLLVGIRI